MKKSLSRTQQAAYDRIKQENRVDWSATTSIEAKAFNALVEKGFVEKKKSGSTVFYQLLASAVPP